MQKKNYRNKLSSIVSLLLILFFLLSAVHFWCFHQPFYDSEHSKLTLYGKSIPEHIGISEDDLKDLTAFTLAYLNNKDASLDRQMIIKGELREVFTDDEKAHMIDVQRLNLTANVLLVLSFVIVSVYLFLYVRKKYPIDELYLSYKRVLKYTLIFLAVLGLWILIDFDSFWTMFHHIFFAGNDLWILDLRKDILIMIVPPDFFNHLVIVISISFFILLLLPVFLYRVCAKRNSV